MAPAAGAGFGDGFYQQTYDSDQVCVIEHERPDWGFLTWSGTTPGDSEIQFEFFSSDFRAELDGFPAEITVTDATSGEPIDGGSILLSEGIPNGWLHLKVRAKLIATSDGSQSPTLAGWSFRYDCLPQL